MNSSSSIESLLPQAPPFVMVGELLDAGNDSATTSFLISDGNLFTENGLFLEAGLLENMAQTLAAGAGYNAQSLGKPLSTGYIGAVKNFEVFHLPKTGQTITTTARITDRVFNAVIVKATVHHGEELLARCELKVFVNDGG